MYLARIADKFFFVCAGTIFRSVTNACASASPHLQWRADGMLFTVVGVAKTTKYDAIGEQPKPIIYLPILQDYTPLATIQARVNGEPAAFARAIEKAVHAQNAEMPIFDEASLEQRVAAHVAVIEETVRQVVGRK